MEYDVAIAGGGMVGMTLAIALAREGVSVTLFESGALSAQLDSTFDGRVSAIALGSKYLLQRIGVWQAMEAYAEPINDIRVSDSDTPFFLHYDHREVSGAPFGYIIENRYIRQALQKTAEKYENLKILDNAMVAGFEYCDDGVKVRIIPSPLAGEGGAKRRVRGSQNSNSVSSHPGLPPQGGKEILSCRLLIGADGKKSKLRALANLGAVEWNYKQTAIVCTIAHEEPHHGLAQERFLGAGPFAVLPMQHNRSSLVWVEPNDRVQLYLDLPEEDFVQEITERVGDYLGKITLAGERFSYPLSLMHAKSYIGKRLALIGDAAHAIHPIAGQGVNLGFRDVAVLAELIANAKNSDIGGDALLAHYQQWRRFDNMTMLTVTDGLNRLFSNNLLPIKLARGLGLWTVGKLPPVKKFFMKHAMGLTGDVPKLMKESA